MARVWLCEAGRGGGKAGVKQAFAVVDNAGARLPTATLCRALPPCPGFHSLRPEDQKNVESHLGAGTAGVARPAGTVATDYNVEARVGVLNRPPPPPPSLTNAHALPPSAPGPVTNAGSGVWRPVDRIAVGFCWSWLAWVPESVFCLWENEKLPHLWGARACVCPSACTTTAHV